MFFDYFDAFRTIVIPKSIHARIKNIPPIGVIAPNQPISVMQRVYKLPEKMNIPSKSMVETRFYLIS